MVYTHIEYQNDKHMNAHRTSNTTEVKKFEYKIQW